ncbi:MAG: PilZ domain-containing protein [Treponema sp.]|nr:PilZ domain-containing protein [Treponema sp.]
MNVKSVLLIIFVVILVIIGVLRLISIFNEKIAFFAKGRENGFRFSEVNIIWKTIRKLGILDPLSLYNSIPTLNRVIAMVLSEIRRGSPVAAGGQVLVSKLNKLRTRVALEGDESSHIQTTAALESGQRLSVIFPGRGVYASVVMNNGRRIEIELPKKVLKTGTATKSEILPPNQWRGKVVTVYMWRKGDACYAFDTTVDDTGTFDGKPCIMLNHTSKLDRIQKRQSVRCECSIDATLFVLKSAEIDYNKVDEEENGTPCCLADISESGALIRLPGKGKGNTRIKIQFPLSNTLIMMFGVVHSVEYDKDKNESKLHFECTYTEDEMRNTLLNYIYGKISMADPVADLKAAAEKKDEANAVRNADLFGAIASDAELAEKTKSVQQNMIDGLPV